MTTRIDILLDFRSRLDAIQQSNQAIMSANEKLLQLRKIQSSTANMFKTGLGAGVGIAVMNSFSQAVTGAIRAGVKFNENLEQQQISLKTLTGNAAESRMILSDLVRFGAETPFNLPEIIQANRLLFTFGGAALAARENLTLIGDTASATGQRFQDVAMWVGRLYSGLRSGAAVGEATLRLLEMGAVSGQTKAQLESLTGQAQTHAQVQTLLAETFGRFSGAMIEQSQSFGGLASTFKDAVDLMQAETFAPVFETLKVALKGFIEQLKDPGGFAEFGYMLADLVGAMLKLISVIVRFSKEIASLGITLAAVGLAAFIGKITASIAAVGGLTAAFASLKMMITAAAFATPFTAVIAALGVIVTLVWQWHSAQRAVEDAMNRKVGESYDELEVLRNRYKQLTSIEEKTKLLADIEAKIAQDRKRLADNAEDLNENQQRALEGSISLSERLLALTREQGDAQAEKNAAIQREIELTKTLAELQKEALGALKREVLEEEAWKIEFGFADPEKQIDMLKRQRSDILLRASRAVVFEAGEEGRELIQLEARNKILKINQEIADIEQKIAEDREKQASAAKQKNEEYWAGIRRQIEGEIRLNEALRETLQYERELADQNGKKEVVNKLIEQEKALVAETAEAYTDLAAVLQGIDPSAAERARLAAERLRNDPVGSGSETEYISLREGAKQGLSRWADLSMGEEMRSNVEGIGNAMQSSIGGALEGLINRTMTWKDALSNIWVSFGQSMQRALTDMVATYAVKQAAMFLIHKANAAKSLALSAVSAAKSLAQWTPSAIAASISSWGAAAAIGTAAVVGLLATQFASGGYTGAGEKYEPAGIVHRGEYVMNKAVTDRVGPAFFDSLSSDILAGRNPNSMVGAGSQFAESPVDQFARSARNGEGQNGGHSGPISIAIVQERNEAQKWLRSRPGRKYLVNTASDSRSEMGIDT